MGGEELDVLLLTVGGQVQEAPGGSRVELCLVPAHHPHIGNTHDLQTIKHDVATALHTFLLTNDYRISCHFGQSRISGYLGLDRISCHLGMGLISGHCSLGRISGHFGLGRISGHLGLGRIPGYLQSNYCFYNESHPCSWP